MTLTLPIFTKINTPFECSFCQKQVPIAQKTCRDHCPHCLHSLHVDNNPGDRQASCGGLLKPIGYDRHKKKGLMILYVCQNCGAQKTNKFLEQDSFCPDNYDTLLRLTQA